MRLTAERKKYIREGTVGEVKELLAEIDALEAEMESQDQALNVLRGFHDKKLDPEATCICPACGTDFTIAQMQDMGTEICNDRNKLRAVLNTLSIYCKHKEPCYCTGPMMEIALDVLPVVNSEAVE